MTIARLQFGKTPETPELKSPGIVLQAARLRFSPDPAEPIPIVGHARRAKAQAPADIKALAAGIIVTAIEAYGQQPVSANLLQNHILFEEDIVDAGNDYAIPFAFDLRQSLALPAAPFTFFVHAGFFSHVSNILVIQLSG